MPYGLIVDGQLRDLQDFKYLLSPQDLMALDQVGGCRGGFGL
jgi:putative protease